LDDDSDDHEYPFSPSFASTFLNDGTFVAFEIKAVTISLRRWNYETGALVQIPDTSEVKAGAELLRIRECAALPKNVHFITDQHKITPASLV
jgi:hypothetical protein